MAVVCRRRSAACSETATSWARAYASVPKGIARPAPTVYRTRWSRTREPRVEQPERRVREDDRARLEHVAAIEDIARGLGGDGSVTNCGGGTRRAAMVGVGAAQGTTWDRLGFVYERKRSSGMRGRWNVRRTDIRRGTKFAGYSFVNSTLRKGFVFNTVSRRLKAQMHTHVNQSAASSRLETSLLLMSPLREYATFNWNSPGPSRFGSS